MPKENYMAPGPKQAEFNALDAEVDALNGKITSFVTLSTTNYNVLADACQAFIDAMGSNKHAVGELGYNSFRYVVDCYKYSDSWATMSLFGYSGASYHCWKENGTWKTEQLALNSNMTTSQENLETGLDITRNGKIRTLRIGKTITSSTIATLSANDRPKMSVNAVMRYKNTSDTYYTALVTVGDDGVISASYFSGTTIATISNGTITGTITYIV